MSQASKPNQTDKKRWESIDDKILTILEDGQPHSRAELSVATRGAVINSAIARIRKKHKARIVCERGAMPGETYYRLETRQWRF